MKSRILSAFIMQLLMVASVWAAPITTYEDTVNLSPALPLDITGQQQTLNTYESAHPGTPSSDVFVTYSPYASGTAQIYNGKITGGAEGQVDAQITDAVKPTAISFNFTLTSSSELNPILDPVIGVILFGNGQPLTNFSPFFTMTNEQEDGIYHGSFDYRGSQAFDSISLIFTQTAYPVSFDISDLSYGSTVPEPGTFVLWSVGIGGLALLKRSRRSGAVDGNVAV